MSPQLLAALPYMLFAVVALAITCEVISAIRNHGRPTVPEDGCCGCGANLADGVLACGKAYCWTCLDTWPAEADSLDELGMQVFPGHERSAR
jgi:hypothetical protein